MLREVYDKVDTIKMLLEEESEGIEPYEGKDDLTEAQNQRQEWLDDTASICQEFLDGLDGTDGFWKGRGNNPSFFITQKSRATI